MKQLANLFHWFHYKLNHKELEALHNFSNALSKIKESSDRDISGLSDTLSLGVLPDLSAYKSGQAKEQLCNHMYVINLFAEFLKKDWPANDAAQEQELISMEISGVAPGGRVYMAKLKHVLEAVKEVQSCKRCKISQAKAPIHMADDPDLGLEEFKSEEPVDDETESEEPVNKETESDDLKVPDFGSSSSILLSKL
jgi:hypothetical protein